MTKTYHNEYEPSAVAWLTELGKLGLIGVDKIDPRSIVDVKTDDLRGFTRCHFFSGIGGWDYALRLAGWPTSRDVWTGSCPCQPYSAAGKKKGRKDERDLWPEFFRLIDGYRPTVIFGEQVASSEVVGSADEHRFIEAIRRGQFERAERIADKIFRDTQEELESVWLDRISADLERIGYTCWAAILGAHSVAGPHIRQRLYWVGFDGLANSGQHTPRDNRSGIDIEANHEPSQRRGETDRNATRYSEPIWMADAEHAIRRAEREIDREAYGRNGSGRCGEHCRLEHATGDGRDERRAESVGRSIASGCRDGGMCDAIVTGLEGHSGDVIDGDEPGRYGTNSPRPIAQAGSDCGPWSDYQFIPCRDGKTRRIKSGLEPLAHGVSGRVAIRVPGERGESTAEKIHWYNRRAALHGLGNAIVPLVAAEFIRAFMETVGIK
jgi:DNA (cytosine-5)-methyltransferase 1